MSEQTAGITSVFVGEDNTVCLLKSMGMVNLSKHVVSIRNHPSSVIHCIRSIHVPKSPKKSLAQSTG